MLHHSRLLCNMAVGQLWDIKASYRDGRRRFEKFILHNTDTKPTYPSMSAERPLGSRAPKSSAESPASWR